MEYKDFSIDLAKKAGAVIRANFRIGMDKEWKADKTPLTITDTTVNKLVIEELKKNFPDHDLLGEEESNLQTGEYVWVCDPVDGTIPFSHGYPIFMFSLALTHKGKSILGVMYDPILDRMFYAEQGKGAFLNGTKIIVSNATNLENKMVNLDTDIKFQNLRNIILAPSVWVSTLYSATYAGSLVACGEFVATVYEYNHPWDGAAVKVIVEEAGGKVTDLDGNEQRYDQDINGFVASNGKVHEAILNAIKKAREKTPS